MTDRIILSGVTARGHHGVLDFERDMGQPFAVDLSIELDLRDAAASDHLAETVSYAEVAAEVVAVVEGEPLDLIEAVAERIASVVLAHERVEAVEVTVHKPEAPVGVPFGDVAVLLRRVRDVPVVVALGANEGSPEEVLATLRSAVRDLTRLEGLHIRRVSRVFRTAPVGGPEQPDYLNAVLVARTRLAASTLLRALQDTEHAHGRRREVRWGPRTLDLDLIQYGDPAAGTDIVRSSAGLSLPHPRAAERAFVLAPWLDADPSAVLRRGADVVSVRALLDDLDTGGIHPGPGWHDPVSDGVLPASRGVVEAAVPLQAPRW